MGIGQSKSPLERRNTVARRSQRRTIHTLKGKVDKVFPHIKRFRGVNKDEDYHAIYDELEHLQNDLIKKSKDLQPQIRHIYDDTLKKIDAGFTFLEDKLKENLEKAQRKERQREEKAEKKKEKNKDDEEVTSQSNDVEVEEIQEEASQEADNLEQSSDKRKTVELKFVQVIPDEVTTEADIHNNNNTKSPEEKRKSILKHGVAVMPGAMMNEMALRNSSSKIDQPVTRFEENNDNINTKINEMIENLQATEYQIADFVGKKNGTQYNRIKDKLTNHMVTLERFSSSDDYTAEQVKICRNYIISCLNFLEEKAIDEEKGQDDVFLPPNVIPTVAPIENPTKSPTLSPTMSPVISPNLSPIDARNRYQRLSKTTAI